MRWNEPEDIIFKNSNIRDVPYILAKLLERLWFNLNRNDFFASVSKYAGYDTTTSTEVVYDVVLAYITMTDKFRHCMRTTKEMLGVGM